MGERRLEPAIGSREDHSQRNTSEARTSASPVVPNHVAWNKEGYHVGTGGSWRRPSYSNAEGTSPPGQFFVDESERRVYETTARSEAGDVYLSRGREFFWAIEQVSLADPVLTLAQAAADAELWCFSGGEIAFKVRLADIVSHGPIPMSLVVPPCQPVGFVVHGDGDLEVKIEFKWRTATESEWEPPTMPEVEG